MIVYHFQVPQFVKDQYANPFPRFSRDFEISEKLRKQGKSPENVEEDTEFLRNIISFQNSYLERKLKLESERLQNSKNHEDKVEHLETLEINKKICEKETVEKIVADQIDADKEEVIKEDVDEIKRGNVELDNEEMDHKRVVDEQEVDHKEIKQDYEKMNHKSAVDEEEMKEVEQEDMNEKKVVMEDNFETRPKSPSAMSDDTISNCRY